MIGNYRGPLPSDTKEFVRRAEELRLNATNINQYLLDFQKLWNSIPEVREISYIKWVESNPKFGNQVRNSHSCPEGGVSNFMGDDDKPKYYPGFTGRLEIIFKGLKTCEGFPSKESNKRVPKLYCYSGTGNGTYDGSKQNYGYSIYVTFWLQDFPKLWEGYQELRNPGILEKVDIDAVCTLLCTDIAELPRYLTHPNKIVGEFAKQKLEALGG